MNFITKLYYTLTAYVPRKLPTNQSEYEHFQNVLVVVYGVPDEPQVWTLVPGFICSTPATSIRASWGGIANAAKRLRINNMAQGYRKAALEALNAKLLAAIEKQNELMKSEASNDKETSQVQQTENGHTIGQASPEPSTQSQGIPEQA